MNNLLIHRLGYVHQNRTDLENLLNLIRTYPGGCDEVWLCGAYGYPTIETHRAHGKAMAEAAKTIRALGVEVSLQISNTIGHGSYMKTEDYSGAAGIPGIVGPDGQENPWCFCPNSEAFRSYLREEIEALCQCRPHVVWLDDDFRMVNHYPVMAGCFCDSCIAAFNRRWGVQMTREQLLQAIGYGPDPAWRERWVDFERESLASLAREITRTVREISPESHMGLQHGEPPFYTGGSHDFIFDALAEASGKPVFSRPGAGFYQEHRPREMVDKALSLHLQNELLPESVTVSCAELEDLPHSPMGKSVRANCIEGTLDIAYGCRALSFTSLQNPYETDWHRRLFTGLASWKPYWERLIAESRDTRRRNGPCPSPWPSALDAGPSGESPFLDRTSRLWRNVHAADGTAAEL